MIKAKDEYYQNFVDAVVEVAERFLWNIREDYSGRGMYGKTCLGIVVDDQFQAGFEIAREMTLLDSLVADDFDMPATRADSMGRDIIIYWPKIELELESADEE